MRKFPVLAAVLAFGLATTACDIKTTANGEFSMDIATGKAEDTWSRTYKVADKGRFELINVNGRITAEPADGAELVVEGKRSVKARSDEGAKELLSKLEIREEVSDATVRVESRPPRLSGFSSHQIEWTIKVPKGVIVDLRTTNGGVRLNNLSNEIHAKTTNGGVKGLNIIATVIEASAVNGGVEIVLGAPLDTTASIEMEAVNGGVELSLPPDSKATIAARCVNGGVQVENLEISREEQQSDFDKRRRLNGTMNGGGAKVNLSTTNGGVRIVRSESKPTT
jgi:lia operon protein LiaG